jgi:hypothetical protein
MNAVLNYQADRLHRSARSRARWAQVRALPGGHSRRLLALDEIADTRAVCSRRSPGIRTVPISQIRGSEGRSRDFDCDFNPLRDHGRDRWMRVALARLEGKSLPPVELIQVGDVYFVRDGHHRISVARALGQPDIEAEVVTWQVVSPLPEGRSTPAGRPALQPA